MVVVDVVGIIKKFKTVAISEDEALRHALSTAHIADMGDRIMRHGEFS